MSDDMSRSSQPVETVQAAGWAGRIAVYARFIKLEHTLFSLPLIFSGALLAAHHWPRWDLAGLILLAAAGARVVAMSLNRLTDAEIDARNPRTQRRELPRKVMRRGEAWAIILVAAAIYSASAAAVAPICFWLSPIPVVLFVIYPYLKRFTSLAHLGLGLAWSMAPLGGWLAISRSLERIHEVAWLWLFSVLWVAGFDIIYATMDERFDRSERLHSLPAALGTGTALRVAMLLHAGAFASLIFLWRNQLNSSSNALPWLAAVGAFFIWQHAVAKQRPEFAFFQINGWLGFFVLLLVMSGVESRSTTSESLLARVTTSDRPQASATTALSGS